MLRRLLRHSAGCARLRMYVYMQAAAQPPPHSTVECSQQTHISTATYCDAPATTSASTSSAFFMFPAAEDTAETTTVVVQCETCGSYSKLKVVLLHSVKESTAFSLAALASVQATRMLAHAHTRLVNSGSRFCRPVRP
jgi:hypothetical protein